MPHRSILQARESKGEDEDNLRTAFRAALEPQMPVCAYDWASGQVDAQNFSQKENHIHGLSVRVCESRWWRRGESNSCPKIYSQEALRAQFVFSVPLS